VTPEAGRAVIHSELERFANRGERSLRGWLEWTDAMQDEVAALFFEITVTPGSEVRS